MDKDDIFDYFRKNPEQSAIIEQAIMSDQVVATQLNKIIYSNQVVAAALERAINSYAPARNELKKIMSHPEVVALLRQKIEESQTANKTIKEAIFRDSYCRDLIFEAILNSGTETLDAIDNAIRKSQPASKLLDNLATQ